MKTTFENKLFILGNYWLEKPEGSEDLIRKYDATFSLAIILQAGYATANDKTYEVIDECWNALLSYLGIQDTGFNSTEELY